MLLANIQYIPESILINHFRHYDDEMTSPFKRLQKAIKSYKKTFSHCHHIEGKWGLFGEKDVEKFRHHIQHIVEVQNTMNYELDKVSHTRDKHPSLKIDVEDRYSQVVAKKFEDDQKDDEEAKEEQEHASQSLSVKVQDGVVQALKTSESII